MVLAANGSLQLIVNRRLFPGSGSTGSSIFLITLPATSTSTSRSPFFPPSPRPEMWILPLRTRPYLALLQNPLYSNPLVDSWNWTKNSYSLLKSDHPSG